MMFDLHNHILPGIDDGSRDMAESLQLLRLAAEQGISHMLATPHINPGRYDNNAAGINDALARLRQAASEQHIDVNVAAAAEVRISSEMLPLVEQGKLPFIGQYQGRNVVLLELPHSHIPPGSDKLLAWLGRKNISVMLAHPERNRDLLAAPEQIKPFIKAGCLFQLTAGALDGDMGPDVMALARHWLKQGVYHIIASDTHSVQRRPPKLGQAFEYVKQVQGEEQAHRLCVSNPAELSSPVFERGMLLS